MESSKTWLFVYPCILQDSEMLDLYGSVTLTFREVNQMYRENFEMCFW
jgi:hypothetical protein